MPTTKVTMLFNYATGGESSARGGIALGGGRQGGWSESWYTSLLPGTAALNEAISALGIARGNLLGSSIVISPIRVQLVDPLGQANLLGWTYTPGSGTDKDFAQAALRRRLLGTSARNRMNLILRGVPDARVVLGVYDPSVEYDRRLDRYFTLLQGWQFRCQDFTAETHPLLTVAADGTYQLAEAGAFTSGQKVKVLRTFNAARRQVSQICTLSVTSSTAGKLADWRQGATTGGTMRLQKTIFTAPTADPDSKVIATLRKVGRPGLVFRGKATRRRS